MYLYVQYRTYTSMPDKYMYTYAYVYMYVCIHMYVHIYGTKKWHESERRVTPLSFLERQIESERYANTWPYVGKATVTDLVHRFRCSTFTQTLLLVRKAFRGRVLTTGKQPTVDLAAKRRWLSPQAHGTVVCNHRLHAVNYTFSPIYHLIKTCLPEPLPIPLLPSTDSSTLKYLEQPVISTLGHVQRSQCGVMD